MLEDIREGEKWKERQKKECCQREKKLKTNQVKRRNDEDRKNKE